MDGVGSVPPLIGLASKPTSAIWSMSFAHDETPIEPKPSHKSHGTVKPKCDFVEFKKTGTLFGMTLFRSGFSRAAKADKKRLFAM